MDDTDRQLVDAFLLGDEAAFSALHARHGPMLFAFATRMIGAEEAEDVLQDAWLRAARSLQRFEWRSTIRSWLCGFVVNCARERLRLRERDAAVAAIPEDPPLWYDATAAQIDLERAIRRLPPRYREVFLLHEIAELTHEEIATSLAIDVGTSKSNASRARAAMRDMLTDSVRAEEGR